MLGRQTPWESSSLTSGFSFFTASVGTPTQPAPKRSVEEWKKELKGKPVAEANELIASGGLEEALLKLQRVRTEAGLRVIDWPKNRFWVASPRGGTQAFLLF
mgnify:CR=1 FL=1